MEGVERQRERGGAIAHGKGGGGTQIIRQHRNSNKLNTTKQYEEDGERSYEGGGRGGDGRRK